MSEMIVFSLSLTLTGSPQGGNDILDGWNAGICQGNATTPSALACYDQILNDTTIMLEAMFKVDPALQVVHFGSVKTVHVHPTPSCTCTKLNWHVLECAAVLPRLTFAVATIFFIGTTCIHD